MVVFPNCKINLGLRVINKRPDNYHAIETVFYPVKFTDVLEIITNNGNKDQFTVTGLPLGDPEDNLCYKAYHLLKKDYPGLPYINLHLHKAIAAGAGLGGGSADAAFTLTLLNEKFSLGLDPIQLGSYALQLGSDCPFFLYNKPCLATGRGELLEPLSLDLSGYDIMLVNPGIKIDTSWAFSKIKPEVPGLSVKDVVAEPLEKWKDRLINDFEKPVFETYPEIKEIKEGLYNAGAVFASLSGSGSTIYGIFDKPAIAQAEFPDAYFCKIISL